VGATSRKGSLISFGSHGLKSNGQQLYTRACSGAGSPGDQAPVNISARSGELGVRRASYEAIRVIRKYQARESLPGGRAILLHRFILGLFSAT